MISHSLWMTQFGGRRDVLGQSVLLDDEPHTIVGVMPASFNFPSRQTSFWAPLRFTSSLLEDRTNWFLNVVARLKDEVSLEQARAEMKGIAAQLALAYPDANARTSATVIDLRDEVTRQARLTPGPGRCVPLHALIACTNLASLLLSRDPGSPPRTIGPPRSARARSPGPPDAHGERAADGGRRGLGGIAAAAVAPLVTRLVPISLPIADVPALDARLLGICLLVTMGTGLLFGVLPPLRLASSASLEGLKAAREPA